MGNYWLISAALIGRLYVTCHVGTMSTYPNNSLDAKLVFDLSVIGKLLNNYCDLTTGQIGSLQATQMSHEATIRDLGSEQNRLKEKILQLEEEREGLQKQMHTLEEQQHQKILNLEKVHHLFAFPLLVCYFSDNFSHPILKCTGKCL